MKKDAPPETPSLYQRKNSVENTPVMLKFNLAKPAHPKD